MNPSSGVEHVLVLVLGAGWRGVAAAAPFATAGESVTVLEASDRAGGCGPSFTRGAFSFCAEVRHLMGCGPDGAVQRWLHALDLHETVTFKALRHREHAPRRAAARRRGARGHIEGRGSPLTPPRASS